VITLVHVQQDMADDDDEIGNLLNNLNISVGGRGDGRHGRRRRKDSDEEELHEEVEMDCYGYSRIQLFVTSILAVAFISVIVDVYSRILNLSGSDAIIIGGSLAGGIVILYGLYSLTHRWYVVRVLTTKQYEIHRQNPNNAISYEETRDQIKRHLKTHHHQ